MRGGRFRIVASDNEPDTVVHIIDTHHESRWVCTVPNEGWHDIMVEYALNKLTAEDFAYLNLRYNKEDDFDCEYGEVYADKIEPFTPSNPTMRALLSRATKHNIIFETLINLSPPDLTDVLEWLNQRGIDMSTFAHWKEVENILSQEDRTYMLFRWGGDFV